MPIRHLNDVATRLRAVGLHPAVVHDIIKEVSHWEEHNGPEWTVARLKSLKTDFVRHLAGTEPVGLYAKKRVRINGKFYRLPKGIFGHLFALGLRPHKGRRTVHRVWQALIIHTRFTSRVVTHRQWVKFSSAVRKPEPTKSELREARRYVSVGLRHLPQAPTYRGAPRPLITYQPREGKRIPHFRSTLKEREILRSCSDLLTHNSFPDEVRRDLIEPVVVGTPYSGRVKGYPRVYGEWRPLHHVGIIGFIQEPGFKLRAVANPNRIVQLALEPLGKVLFNWLRSIPQDCTYNQDYGVYAVQGVLARGELVHSVDLSNATDVFPYTLLEQVEVFAKIPRPARHLLRSVARASWLTPMHSTVKKVMTLKWNRGTPLGVYPCFALFALAHHALVRGICVLNGAMDFPYLVLGDDIVIWNTRVAEEYKRVLGVLGCPIALEKTLSSDKIAEFAGRVISPEYILHGLKYGEVNDNAFLEQVKNMGPRTIRFLLPKQRAVATFISECVAPVGFGYNPRGLSYRERLAMAMAWELSAPRESSSEAIVQISVAVKNWYSYKYSEVRSRAQGPDPWRSKRWDPYPVVQTGYTAEQDALARALRANFVGILESQSFEKAVKGEAGWLLELVQGGTTTVDRPDHPFNKPLVQSLYPRLQRARRLVPECLAWLEQFN